MSQQKEIIQNRIGQNIVAIVEVAVNQKGLAFVMHGLRAFKEEPQVVAIAQAFSENAYTVIRFDFTNSTGESDGLYDDATLTNNIENLDDVAAWAREQPWYDEPFYLAGHSLGGITSLLFAESYPQEVKGVVAFSTVVSGQRSYEALSKQGRLEEWQKTGWRVERSESRPGLTLSLKYSHLIDRMKYDLLPLAGELRMPILQIVGSEDTSTPRSDQQVLFDALPGSKELHVVNGAKHNFRSSEHLEELKATISQWLKKQK